MATPGLAPGIATARAVVTSTVQVSVTASTIADSGSDLDDAMLSGVESANAIAAEIERQLDLAVAIFDANPHDEDALATVVGLHAAFGQAVTMSEHWLAQLLARHAERERLRAVSPDDAVAQIEEQHHAERALWCQLRPLRDEFNTALQDGREPARVLASVLPRVDQIARKHARRRVLRRRRRAHRRLVIVRRRLRARRRRARRVRRTVANNDGPPGRRRRRQPPRARGPPTRGPSRHAENANPELEAPGQCWASPPILHQPFAGSGDTSQPRRETLARAGERINLLLPHGRKDGGAMAYTPCFIDPQSARLHHWRVTTQR